MSIGPCLSVSGALEEFRRIAFETRLTGKHISFGSRRKGELTRKSDGFATKLVKSCVVSASQLLGSEMLRTSAQAAQSSVWCSSCVKTSGDDDWIWLASFVRIQSTPFATHVAVGDFLFSKIEMIIQLRWQTHIDYTAESLEFTFATRSSYSSTDHESNIRKESKTSHVWGYPKITNPGRLPPLQPPEK